MLFIQEGDLPSRGGVIRGGCGRERIMRRWNSVSIRRKWQSSVPPVSIVKLLLTINRGSSPVYQDIHVLYHPHVMRVISRSSIADDLPRRGGCVLLPLLLLKCSYVGNERSMSFSLIATLVSIRTQLCQWQLDSSNTLGFMNSFKVPFTSILRFHFTLLQRSFQCSTPKC